MNQPEPEPTMEMDRILTYRRWKDGEFKGIRPFPNAELWLLMLDESARDVSFKAEFFKVVLHALKPVKGNYLDFPISEFSKNLNEKELHELREVIYLYVSTHWGWGELSNAVKYHLIALSDWIGQGLSSKIDFVNQAKSNNVLLTSSIDTTKVPVGAELVFKDDGVYVLDPVNGLQKYALENGVVSPITKSSASSRIIRSLERGLEQEMGDGVVLFDYDNISFRTGETFRFDAGGIFLRGDLLGASYAVDKGTCFWGDDVRSMEEAISKHPSIYRNNITVWDWKHKKRLSTQVLQTNELTLRKVSGQSMMSQTVHIDGQANLFVDIRAVSVDWQPRDPQFHELYCSKPPYLGFKRIYSGWLESSFSPLKECMGQSPGVLYKYSNGSGFPQKLLVFSPDGVVDSLLSNHSSDSIQEFPWHLKNVAEPENDKWKMLDEWEHVPFRRFDWIDEFYDNGRLYVLCCVQMWGLKQHTAKLMLYKFGPEFVVTKTLRLEKLKWLPKFGGSQDGKLRLVKFGEGGPMGIAASEGQLWAFEAF